MSVVSFALAVVFIIRLFSTSAFRVPNNQSATRKKVSAIGKQANCGVFLIWSLCYKNKSKFPYGFFSSSPHPQRMKVHRNLLRHRPFLESSVIMRQRLWRKRCGIMTLFLTNDVHKVLVILYWFKTARWGSPCLPDWFA